MRERVCSIFAALTYGRELVLFLLFLPMRESLFYFCCSYLCEVVCSIFAVLTYEREFVLFLLFLPMRESLYSILLFLPMRESLFFLCCSYL